MRRYIYIILGVIAVVLIAIVLFSFFSIKNKSVGTPTGTTGSLPQTGTQTNGAGASTSTSGSSGGSVPIVGAVGSTKFGLISNELVFNYFDGPQNNITIIEPDGKIAQITNGTPTFLSSARIADLISANFSYDGTKAFVSFGDPTNPQTSIFDFATKAWTPLPAGVASPAWSPSDDRIAYLQNNADGTKALTTLDASKTAARPSVLLSLNMQDVSVGWQNANQIVLGQKASAYAQSSVWFFNIQKRALSRAVAAATGLEAAWSNGTSSLGIVFSSGNGGFGGSVSLVDPINNTSQSLAILTLPSKCAFNYEPVSSGAATSTTSGTYLALYCAVPQGTNVFDGLRLPDDYYQTKLLTADSFYRIHLDTGGADSILSPTQAIDGTNLKLFNNILFFVNRYDQKLYAISLAQ